VPLEVIGEAATGREALELLQGQDADLVLLDIRMPEMGGVELAEHLLKLQTLMAKQGQTPLGDPVYARYDAPFVPWFWRRNEIWMPVR
jgi:CheY-like chemotaxis protein